jgi:hypothetical protein
VCNQPWRAQEREERDAGFEGEKEERRYVARRERRSGREVGV